MLFFVSLSSAAPSSKPSNPGAARQVVGTKPKKQMKARPTEDFSRSSDGRFVINDEEADEGEPSEQEKPLDIRKDDMLGGFDKTPKQIKLGSEKDLICN